MSAELAIEARNLRKSYGDVEALRGVDLRIEAGSVYGLLGPNGAGKTTAVRILTTLLPLDEGEARVAGFDVVSEGPHVRERIGLAGQYAAVDENLTGFENLEMVGRLYHLGRGPSRQRADELLAAFDLSDAGGRLVRTYSGGMRRRLDLAAALVARPPVLFLDEPTTGLDIRSRIGLWDAIEDLVAEGTTVLLTTQYLDEADRLAERIAVIDQGLVIAEGTSDELKAQVGGDRLELRLDDPAHADAGLVALSALSDCRPSSEDGVLRIPLKHEPGEIAQAVRLLDDAGIGIEDITVLRPTLDDVFLTLTGRPAEPSAEEEQEHEPVTEKAA
jgi:ABC-2 type transport system ATP-binding protein